MEIIKTGTTGERHTKNSSTWLFILNGLAKNDLSSLYNNLDNVSPPEKKERHNF